MNNPIAASKTGTVSHEVSGADRAPGVISSAILVLGICGLIIAWPMPNVIALRNILLVLLAGLILVSSPLRSGLTAVLRPRAAALPIGAYILFLAWSIIVALLVSDSPGASLLEIKGQWLPATLALTIGLAAGAQLARDTDLGRNLKLAVIITMFAHPTVHLLYGMGLVLFGDGLPHDFSGYMDHRANVTYVNAIAIAFVFADLLSRIRRGRGLVCHPGIAAAGLIIVATSSILAITRNGVITLLVLSALFAFLALGAAKISRARKSAAVLLFLIVCGAYLAIAYKTDARWQRLMATAPVAWDIDTHHTWIDSSKYPPPPAADGGPVDVSAYERIAWARLGSRFVLQHPFGTEISRQAFKHLVARQYGEAYMGHSHVGYIDLAISAGFPGLLSWLAFIGLLLAGGWRAFASARSIWGLVLFFVVAGYAIRCSIDSIIRDHIIQEFMFFAGLLIAAQMIELETSKSNGTG